MREPLGLARDLLAFKRDALAFFDSQDGWRGDVLTVDFGVREVHVVAEADLATRVLTHDAFVRGRDAYGPLETMAGQGSLGWLLGPTLPTLDGEEGTRRRSRVRPMYVAIARRLRNAPLPALDWSALEAGELDLFSLVSCAVFDLVCLASFGATYPEWGERVCEAVSRATSALDQTSKSLRPYACRVGRHASTIRRSRATLARFARVVLDDLRAHPERNAPMRPLSEPDWSDEDAIDEIVTTLVAGVETTTITCCWAAIELARAPEWADFVRRSDTPTEHADLVLDETMRLYPAFWTMIRVASRACSIEGHDFGAGDVLFVSPFLIHRNPAYWSEPQRFDPTRHVDRVRVAHGDFMPFGFGARACIGAHLSRLVARRVVEALCDAPPMEFVPGEPDGPTPDPKIIVLTSRSGFRVMVREPRASTRAR